MDSQIESGIISGFDDADHGISGGAKLNDSGTGTSLLDFGPKETKSKLSDSGAAVIVAK